MQTNHSNVIFDHFQNDSNNSLMSLSRQKHNSNFFGSKQILNNSKVDLRESSEHHINLIESKKMGHSIKFNTQFCNYDQSDEYVNITFMFNIQINNLPLVQNSFSNSTDLSELYDFVENTEYVKRRNDPNRNFKISYSPSWNSECLPDSGSIENYINFHSNNITLYVNFQ
ncbi:hypothetical protein TVAG_129590 [Trichomonas vaginalis G3]|uniref:Uncharacterized protein n=1 Tax=Trichomonas vaginalis (strain ATCC PRA-98 / G3) TaxID=412133 RepID=A2DI55_TRIV3|nr:hypothetical protein TVAGG3_0712600 [Trichomonas vaginalis G3]EAY19851.1 hypothetical protein TVAG_129590 [Trichomonas vaginalis G3]KAI5510020.1 hypothetical protein TVAGG3_0712600 [Trichomonas vaginalis G3]|eukprot:XP_001580837.1 hypothetical protein [Trichomonas vaginalis G3]